MHPIPPLTPRDVSDLRRDIVAYINAKRRRFRVHGPDIDDLAQSALTKLFAGMHTYRPERGDFRAWAFGIVHHLLCHYARDKHRYNERFSGFSENIDEYEGLEPSPELNLQRQEARRAIANIADNLEPQQWAVFTLFAIDDVAHRDIGQQLGISESASQKCYQRTRNKLAECLDDEFDVMMMPLVTTTCNDKPSKLPISRWSFVYHGGHYLGQVASLVAGTILALSLKTPPHLPTKEIHKTDYALATVVVPQDKPIVVVPSETEKPPGKPMGKHEPPPAPKFQAVRGSPKTTVCKSTSSVYEPPYNPPASPETYRQLGR